jgi:ATP-dependent helicase/DNAse subunit B
LFGLEVPEPFDLEVDALTKGRLIHQVLETAIAKSPFANRTLQEVETLVDQAALKLKIALHEPILWKGQRRRLAVGLLGYLEYEKDWRRRFPKTETILAEARFRGFWNIETDQWFPYSSHHVLSDAEIEISGTIDRVDLVGENQVVVLDYKSSSSQLTGASSWLAKGKYQLWIYMQALKHGLVSARSDMSPMDVVGAFYIDVKGRDRKKGLITEAAVGLAAEISNPAAAKKVLTTEALAIFDSEISESIRAKLKRLKAGHMSPTPSDDKICAECDWRTVCRAQHLVI